MTARVRRLVVLGTGAVLTAALTAPSSAGASSAAPPPISTAYACSQQVASGYATCFAERRTDVKYTSKAQAALAGLPNGGYSPTDLQSAYALPSTTSGTGQRVFVVDAYDDPNAAADLNTYRSQYGLPPCTTITGCFQKLNQTGASSPLPSPNSGWAGEISLDLDMVSAICPNCAITLIEAKNNNFANLMPAVKLAGDLGAKFVSMSWGGSEIGNETSNDTAYFRSSGVVYTASTGDNAYQDGTEYPATSARTVAVGGTALTSAANTRGWDETVWKTTNTKGTGSGCSIDVPKPSWQSIIPSTVCSRRAESDVSAVADPATGVSVYQTYGGSGWTIYGGTSVASPIIASTFALAGTPDANVQPGSLPYANPANLNDVTVGNNGSCAQTLLCTAAVGWDGPTGLGTPNGLVAFGGTGGGGGTGNTVTVTNPGAQTATVGTGVNLQMQASDSGALTLTYGATGLPSGLSIDPASGLISGTPTAPGTFSTTVTAQDSTSASGSATFSWMIGSGGGGGPCSAQLLVNPGFESGSTAWTATNRVINTDGARARTGQGYAWLDGYGVSHTDTLLQKVTIPAGCSATLSYYLWISSADTTTKAHDKLKVTVNGTLVQTLTNLDKGSGYVLRSVNLSAYAGQIVKIKWAGVENASLATSFFMDDTALTLS